jgi:glycosyltransferase involved in cell wall biosynthesis
MTKLALVLLTYDGIESLYCGVGAITQYQLASLGSIRDSFRSRGVDLSTHVLYSNVSDSSAKSSVIAERTRTLCDEASAALIPIRHRGPGLFGTPASWPGLCCEAARYIESLTKTSDRIIVMAQDTPFAGLPLMLPVASAGQIRVVWIAHSTGRVWNRDPSDLDIRRDDWEKIALDEARKREHIFLGAPSDYMTRHLTNEWGARPEKVLAFRNGVSLSYLERFERRPHSILASVLQRAGIPLDVPLFLSFARAHWYKGLDLAARIGAELASCFGVHPIIMALDDGAGEATVNLARAREILESSRAPHTVLTDYSTLLPRWIMQWPLCSAVAVMSRREPFGLIPSEYRVLGPADGLLITSDAGGLREQTPFENEGIVLQLNGSTELSMDALRTVIDAWPRAGQLMCNRAGRRRVEETYDLELNLSRSLAKLAALIEP